jgi:hypothetical protein
MLRLLDTSNLTIRVDVFYLANEIAKSLILASCTVADRCIATAHGDLNHNHIQGDGGGAFLDAPPPKSLVGRRAAYSHKFVARRTGLSGRKADLLKFSGG